MNIVNTWAGNMTGTNIGKIFLKLEGNDDNLTGEMRFNESGIGIVIYTITGHFSDNTLHILGTPSNQIEGSELENISVAVQLNERGELLGEWETKLGSAGAVILFPQKRLPSKNINTNPIPTFLSANHNFNSIFLDKKAIKNIGRNLQLDFPNSEVVITVVNETEKRCLLKDFEAMNFDFEKADNIILFAQESEANGTTKTARLDFGQAVNLVTIQGSDESWVLGKLSMIRQELQKHERAFPNTVRKYGIGLNHVFIFGGLVFMPSLRNFPERILFMTAILTLVLALNYLSKKLLPNAVLYLGEKPASNFQKYFPPIVSWIMAIAATLMAVAIGEAFSRFGVPFFETM